MQDVGATGAGHDIRALDLRQNTVAVVQRAVVAQHGVGTAAGVDQVGAKASDDDLVAVAGADVVFAAQRGQAAADLHKLGTDRVQLDPAQVAQDRVLADAGGDAVTAHATQHRVVAVAEHDLVSIAGGSRAVGAAVADGKPDGVVVDLPVVADDDMPAHTGDHAVAAKTGDHRLLTSAQQQAVVATQVVLCRADLLEQRAGTVHLHQAVVGQDRVLAAAGGDAVGAQASEHGVVAVAQQDLVGRAGIGRDVGRAVAGGQAGGVEFDLCVVAGHHMLAGTSADAVGAKAGNHPLVAVAQADPVVATQPELAGHDLGKKAARVVQLHAAVVAQHRILSSAGGDGVATQAAQHGVVTVTQGDLVCRASGG